MVSAIQRSILLAWGVIYIRAYVEGQQANGSFVAENCGMESAWMKVLTVECVRAWPQSVPSHAREPSRKWFGCLCQAHVPVVLLCLPL